MFRRIIRIKSSQYSALTIARVVRLVQHRIGWNPTDGKTEMFKKNVLHSALKISATGYSPL
jgi:hypothetical protein